MPDPVTMVALDLPLQVVRTRASVEIRDAGGRRINLYVEDDQFRRFAVPTYWRSPEARALACWIARKLTDAIESGELVAVNRLELDG